MLTDTRRLEEKIKESGLKKGYLAKALNLSRYGFYKKINGEISFKGDEEKQLCKMLNICPKDRKDIFLQSK